MDLTATIVKPGEPYRVAQTNWAGTPFFSSKDFGEVNKLRSGDLASQQTLRASLATIDTAYRRQGYMDVSVDAIPQFDTAAHRVTYTVAVISGEQYQLREVQTVGLTPESRATFRRSSGSFTPAISTTPRMWKPS